MKWMHGEQGEESPDTAGDRTTLMRVTAHLDAPRLGVAGECRMDAYGE